MLDYYVYKHIDPRTGELLYVGYGSKERAWRCGHKGTSFRSKHYTDFMDTLLAEGFIPTDWVEIFARGLSKNEAYALEQALIKETKPRFNVSQGVAQSASSVPVEEREEMRRLRMRGYTYQKIVDETGWSIMTVIKYCRDVLGRKKKGYVV